MKKILLSIFILATIATQAQTPITLNRSDFPCPTTAQCGSADSILVTNVLATSNPDITLTGANTNWDYSTLTGASAFQNFVPVSGTPAIFQLTFLGSDYAIPLLGNQAVAGLPVTDAFEYYNYSTTSTRLEIKGFAANITIPGQTTAIPLPAIYTSADVLYRFPVAFGNVDSSNSSFSVAIPPITPIATVKREQKRFNNVDGWGSIITPDGTFDVLRIKSTITRIDSIIFGIIPIGVPTTTNEYKWIGKAMKVPVLQINTNVLGANETPTTIVYRGGNPVGVQNVSMNQSEILLSPNPATSNLNINFEVKSNAKVQIEIISMIGQKVAHFEFMNLQSGNHQEMLPIQGLQAGNYMIRVINGAFISNSKLTIK